MAHPPKVRTPSAVVRPPSAVMRVKPAEMRPVAAVLAIFRIVAAEFAAISDELVKQWVELTVPLVSHKHFGKMWDQAVALLTAHRMKLAGVGQIAADDPLANIGNISIGNLMRTSSYSEGSVSISFGSGAMAGAGKDGDLELTPYGVQYLTLRRMMIMPITSAGQAT